MRSSLSETGITPAMLESREAFEAACRAAAHVDGDVCTVLGGYKLHTIRGDESLTPHLRRDGFWESWVSLALGRHIKPGMRCVDVGANVGYFTLLMADRAGPEGWLLAVEPQPQCLEQLEWTLRDNRLLPHTVVYRGVASSWNFGAAEVFLYGNLVGSASTERAKGYQPTGHLWASCATLDWILRDWDRTGWDRVDAIKIDAEGAEAGIWTGMQETIRRNLHLLITVEVSVERSYDLGAFLHRIESDGFPLRVIEEDGVPREWSLDKIVEHAVELPTLWLQRE